MLTAPELGEDINELGEAWASAIKRAGGLKLFCLDHANKIKWFPSKFLYIVI
jgi:hypothetical protein